MNTISRQARRLLVVSGASILFIGIAMLPEGRSGLAAGKSKQDPLRLCRNRAIHESKRKAREDYERRERAAGRKVSLFSRHALGNNPREGQYRKEMERLLSQEILNVKRDIRTVQTKHRELVQLYPQLKTYHEIVLRKVARARRGGATVSMKRTLIVHYGKQGVECVVLDSIIRNIYQPDQWTRRIMRLYYPNVRTIELETYRKNYRMLGSLDGMSAELQIKGLRSVGSNLRSAVYSMDALIASFYDHREKVSDWQIGL